MDIGKMPGYAMKQKPIQRYVRFHFKVVFYIHWELLTAITWSVCPALCQKCCEKEPPRNVFDMPPYLHNYKAIIITVHAEQVYRRLSDF